LATFSRVFSKKERLNYSLLEVLFLMAKEQLWKTCLKKECAINPAYCMAKGILHLSFMLRDLKNPEWIPLTNKIFFLNVV